MHRKAFLVCALGLSALGCGNDGEGGISALFEALNGDYELPDASGCVIAIRGSRFETRALNGATTCTEPVVDDGEQLETLRISGTLSDTRLTGTLFHDNTWPLHSSDGECGAREGNVEEIVASADKLSDRSSEGRFAGLAGTWEGEVRITEYGVVTDCDGAAEKWDERTSTYTFTANVDGSSIDVTYDEGGDPDTFEVLASSAGDLIVDGEVIRFESE
jgi:hypothetical protein